MRKMRRVYGRRYVCAYIYEYIIIYAFRAMPFVSEGQGLFITVINSSKIVD